MELDVGENNLGKVGRVECEIRQLDAGDRWQPREIVRWQYRGPVLIKRKPPEPVGLRFTPSFLCLALFFSRLRYVGSRDCLEIADQYLRCFGDSFELPPQSAGNGPQDGHGNDGG